MLKRSTGLKAYNFIQQKNDTSHVGMILIPAGEFMMGVRKLHAFQMKVQTRVTPADPALASLLVNAAQAVIDAVNSP